MRKSTPRVGVGRDRAVTITIETLNAYVRACQPNAVLRDREDLSVRVWSIAPRGGPDTLGPLAVLLNAVNQRVVTPFVAHVTYKNIHPFTGGNGRSGRALWLWLHEGQAPLGFLHRFYYEALEFDPLGRRAT